MKKLLTTIAAAVAYAAIAADTDCGALITTGNIADSAKVENLTGANAGKATITINDNSGTAKSVTVYNSSTMDTALAGKASTGDLSAHVENKNNPHGVTAEQVGALPCVRTDNNGIIITNNISFPETIGISIYSPQDLHFFGSDDERFNSLYSWIETEKATMSSSIASSTNALWNTIPSWARASSKPSYNYSEIGSKPTTIDGYGITDAKIANGTITLGSNSITPLTSYTETDPVWTAAKDSYSTTAQMNSAITAATNGLAKASALSGYVPTSRKVAGMALTGDITLKSLSIVGASTTTYNGSAAASVNQSTLTEAAKTSGGTSGKTLTLAVASTSRSLGEYYISIGNDGKPHLMLRQ